jgi:AsmA protein
MLLRRPILVLAVGALALAGLGLRDWPVDRSGAVSFANRTLAAYGLALSAEGPATFRLLPFPELNMSRLRLAAPGGPALAEGEHLAVEIDPVGFLTGGSPVGGVRFDTVRLSPDEAAWSAPMARLRQGLGNGLAPPRLVLGNARIGDDGLARDLALEVAWPLFSAGVTAKASLVWRGVPTRVSLTRLRTTDLLDGRRSPFAAEATWQGGSLALDGTMALDTSAETPASFAGRARFETQSLADTLAWIGRDAPLAPLAGAFSVEGTFETQGRAVSWPVLRIATGSASLEGAGAFSLGVGDRPRPSVQATLAADRLDFGPLTGAVMKMFDEGTAPVALAPLTRGDLDLRMSASEGRVGPLALGDLAASVLVRGAAVEVALNRARLKDGVLKGRLTLVQGGDPAETDMRLQGGFDQVDLGGLMSDLGGSRWVTGPLQGQFLFDSRARDAAGLIARAGGRATVAIDGGALAGLDLADVIHRNGHLAPGALARRNGRTGFERAQVALRFTDGVGEITEADLRGAGVAATLRGQVSLPDQSLDVVAVLSPRQPIEGGRAIRIKIAGPWDALTAQGQRGETEDLGARPPGEGQAGVLHVPAALDLPGASRAYAP